MHGENYEINCPNGETSLRQNKVYAADPGVSHLSEDVVRVGAVRLLLLWVALVEMEPSNIRTHTHTS